MPPSPLARRDSSGKGPCKFLKKLGRIIRLQKNIALHLHVAFSISLCHTWNHHDPEKHNWPNPFPALRRLPSLVFCPISSVWESSMALSASFSLEGWGHDHQTATQLRSIQSRCCCHCLRTRFALARGWMVIDFITTKDAKTGCCCFAWIGQGGNYWAIGWFAIIVCY